MKNKFCNTELLLSLLLLVLATLFCNPLQALWMPTMFMSGILLCFILVFILFAAFVWKERVNDEREEHHRLIAGRTGFLVGATVLVVGIIYQSLNHSLDTWLLIALGLMIVAKLLALLYSQNKN